MTEKEENRELAMQAAEQYRQSVPGLKEGRPPLETYNYKEEVYPYFHGTITTNPNMQWACEAAFNAAVAGGAELIYNAEGEQLIVENDKVVGAYAKTPDGYLKVNAKAVVLCCGDYGANPEMRHYYAPWTEENAKYIWHTA